MASLQSLKKRIKTVKNIAKVTKAMQVAATLKMRKAQQAAISGRLFTEKMSEISAYIVPPQPSQTQTKTIELIIIAPDRGLCGSLISNLLKGLSRWVQEIGRENINTICVNPKSQKIANQLGLNVSAVFDISVNNPDTRKIKSVLEIVKHDLAQNLSGTCFVAHMDYVNLMQQKFSVFQLLPLLVGGESTAIQTDMLIEPDPVTVHDSLVPRALQMKLYQAILETAASESSARAMAMKSASENASDIGSFLTSQYNKKRQAGITAEIAEVVGGSLI